MNPWLSAAGLTMFSTLDAWMTRSVLALGGVELNPLVAPWVDHVMFVWVKSGAVGVVAAAVALRGRPRWLLRVLYAVTAVYGAVVAWNLAQIGGVL